VAISGVPSLCSGQGFPACFFLSYILNQFANAIEFLYFFLKRLPKGERNYNIGWTGWKTGWRVAIKKEEGE